LLTHLLILCDRQNDRMLNHSTVNFVLMFNCFVINSCHYFFPLEGSILPFYFEGEFFVSLQDWEIIPPSPRQNFQSWVVF
jgi:hypothetical protein